MFHIKNKMFVVIVHFGLPLLSLYVLLVLHLSTLGKRIPLVYSALYLTDRFYPKIVESIKKIINL